jgi:hypothetical protein
MMAMVKAALAAKVAEAHRPAAVYRAIGNATQAEKARRLRR